MSIEPENFRADQASNGLRERLEEKNEGFNDDNIYWRGEYTFVECGKEEKIYFPEDGWLELDQDVAEDRVSKLLDENDNSTYRRPYEIRSILEGELEEMYPDDILDPSQVPSPQSVEINGSHLTLANIFTDRSGFSYSSYSETFRAGANVNLSSMM